MKPLKIEQNFRRRKAWIVTHDQAASVVLQRILDKLGVEQIVCPAEAGALVALPKGLGTGDDIVFLDGDLNLPESWSAAPPDQLAAPLASLGEAAAENISMTPCPVVGLVGSEAPSRLRALLRLGAGAFLPRPVQGGAVFSAMVLAASSFAQVSALQADVGELRARRRERVHVIRAMVRLMHHHRMPEQDAYAFLRKEAMRRRQSIEEFCRDGIMSDQDEVRPLFALAKKKGSV